MKTNFIAIVSGLCLLLTLGCDVINPPEEIPSYLYIDKFQVNSTVGEGSNSDNITEAFVFVNNSFVGAYTLPATFPVLETGDQKIDVYPGIKDNGIDATPEIYPFYTSVVTNLTLEATQVDTIRPVIEYRDDIKFSVVEGFESSLQIFRDDIDEDDGTFIDLTDTDVFEGDKSGVIVLSKDHPVIQVASIRLEELPTANREVYLELDYKAEVPLEIGLFYYDNANFPFSDFQHGLNANLEWTKIYINLTPEFTGLNNFTDLKNYQIGIRSLMERDDDGNYLDGTRKILLDNLKFIYF